MFKVKFDIQTNWNMQNSKLLSTFSVLDWEYLTWAYLIQKNKNYQFILEFGTSTNSNMKISMVMFFNFFFEQKYSFFSKSISKNQYCLLKLKRRIKTTSNM